MNHHRIGKVFVIFALGVLALVAFWGLRQLISRSGADIPTELKEPKVIVGSNLVNKGVFLEDTALGEISSIAYGHLRSGSGSVIAVVGQTGAIFLNEQADPIETVSFEPEATSAFGDTTGGDKRYGKIQIVDVDGDGSCEFLVRNSFRRAELIDHFGRTVWTYGEGYQGDSWLGDMAAGDSNGDRRMEYFALDLKGEGVVALDGQLLPIWRQRAVRGGHIEVVDAQNNGKLDIVYDDHSQLVLLDSSSGRIISQNETGHYIGPFSLVRWPTTSGREYVLHKIGDRIILIDFAGKTVAEYRAPLSPRLLDVYGTTVKLRSSEASCFAAVAVDSSMKRSVLYIYDSAGELIYQELLAQICSSIAAFPLGESGTEALLLGGEGRVLQYDMPH